jgi:uncharacterized protein YacL
VPKAVQKSALIVLVCGVLIGLVLGSLERMIDHLPYDPIATLRVMGIGSGLGLLVGILFATWLLCLGYVYADSRRRAMPPVLWVLITILFPHLLGFLLYFAMRGPIVIPCTNCGEANSLDQ